MDRFPTTVAHLSGEVVRLTFADRSEGMRALTWRDVLSRWKADAQFCDAFSSALAGQGLDAFAWETPALTAGALGQEFECVITSSPMLARRRADPSAFAAHLSAGSNVVAFRNLSGDADLVVPRDLGTGADHAHLGAFLRTAAPAQVHSLWRLASETAEAWLARGEPFWVSTAGLGVAWLHVRLDKRPKYYRYAPNRSFTG